MKNKLYTTLLLTLIIGLEQTQAQFYNQGSEVTIQAGAVVTVEGNFRNEAGSNFKNSGTVEIKGYPTNNQPMTDHFGGLWRLNGTSTQKIAGVEPFWMNVLELNNAGGFLLQNSILINKQVDFVAGIMDASAASNVVTFQKDANIGSPTPSNASHITGNVIKEGEGQTFTYPVGDGTKYQPIRVNLIGNENGLLGKYNVGDAGPGIGFGTGGSDPTLLYTYNSKEYWDLIPVNNGVTKADITVYWDSYNDGLGDAANYRKVAHLDGATNKWLNEGISGIGSLSAGSVTSNTVSTWSPFTLGAIAAVALPVRLIDFSGKKVDNNNQLNWTTSQEINASHFEIERSADAKMFEKIGKVLATGHSVGEKNDYQYVDYQANNGNNYYRLKMIDLNGRFDYSKIITLKADEESNIVGNFYPNRAVEDKSKIVINTQENSEWQITQINATGKVLKSELRILEKGYNNLEIKLLDKGLNLIQFQNNGKSFVRKVIN